MSSVSLEEVRETKAFPLDTAVYGPWLFPTLPGQVWVARLRRTSPRPFCSDLRRLKPEVVQSFCAVFTRVYRVSVLVEITVGVPNRCQSAGGLPSTSLKHTRIKVTHFCLDNHDSLRAPRSSSTRSPTSAPKVVRVLSSSPSAALQR